MGAGAGWPGWLPGCPESGLNRGRGRTAEHRRPDRRPGSRKNCPPRLGGPYFGRSRAANLARNYLPRPRRAYSLRSSCSRYFVGSLRCGWRCTHPCGERTYRTRGSRRKPCSASPCGQRSSPFPRHTRPPARKPCSRRNRRFWSRRRHRHGAYTCPDPCKPCSRHNRASSWRCMHLHGVCTGPDPCKPCSRHNRASSWRCMHLHGVCTGRGLHTRMRRGNPRRP